MDCRDQLVHYTTLLSLLEHHQCSVFSQNTKNIQFYFQANIQFYLQMFMFSMVYSATSLQNLINMDLTLALQSHKNSWSSFFYVSDTEYISKSFMSTMSCFFQGKNFIFVKYFSYCLFMVLQKKDCILACHAAVYR